MANTLERGHTRVRGFNDAEMDFQLIRQLGASRYGGASVGECLALASQIEDANPASWVQAFERAAHRQLQDAIHRNERGHLISARDQYLVACNNFRAAEYYTPIDAPSHRTLGLASREAFLHAMHCAGLVCERWWFEINNETLPAYYIHRPNQVAKRILAIVSGFDGTLEESCLMYGAPALERGFDVLCFSGPGQMDSWRFNETSHFRPDFEVIGHQVIERLLGLDSNTNSKQIALMGISFGGYFATRIATHEPRFNALIANSPILDLHAYMTSFVGLDPAELSDDDNFGPDDLQHIPDHVMDKQKRAMAANLIKRFGQATFRDTYRYLRNFRIDLKALSQIHLPCLGLVGEAEGDQPLSQAIEFVQRIGANASLHVFTAQEGADGHCQSANPAFSAAVSMDWLEEVLPNDG